MAASVEDAVTDGKDSPRFPAPRFRNCAILSAMSASPQPHRIPVEEYLSTSYRPDRDYVDGEIEERNLGEKEHSILQLALAVLFRMHRDDWKDRA